ncbi:ExbD/TolR family protein [Neptuniibacter caesariensis]|uniref:Putative TonB system-dependent transport protein n=1 Tax=Neptuniibacter caesariensis TaxID=207954 RepID=A0A7U8C417_NEPCE|nr:biopolymer transporter ExbD [Neptuniibacter caesariensis]EAR59509.1 putative TonB system-dependent transport protein [Oceanospirillum sp. MED92] [Neptuniibacter caesariensis]
MRQRILLSQQQEDAEINMTPMLDVVFIMLIFFIVSTSFVRESGIDVNRPSAETSESKTKTAVMVAISAENEIWVDRKPVDVRMVRPAIERLKSEQSEINIVIQADESATTGQLVKVIDQLRMAKVQYTVATQAGAK